MKTVIYMNRGYRIGISLVASFYIIFYARPFEIGRALTSPAFYLAFSVSFAVTLSMVKMVHYITVWLDKHMPWDRMSKQRPLFQILLCVVLPLLLDFVLLAIYFHIGGTSIFASGFISHDFPLIISFIFILNLYYVTHCLLYLHKQNSTAEVNTEIAIDDKLDKFSNDTLAIQYSGMHLNLDVIREVLCFYRDGKKVFALTIQGNKFPVKESISNIEEQFRDSDFCRINRSLIINCDVVRGYSPAGTRNTFLLILKPEIAEIAKTVNEKQFFITKEYLNNFRERCNLD